MTKTKYAVEIAWKSKGTIYIEAKDEEELKEILRNDVEFLVLPKNYEDIEGSIEIVNYEKAK